MWGGVQLGPLGTAATNRPIVPTLGGYDDGEISGMIGKGNRSTRRKPAPVPLCSPQTPTCCRDANPGRRDGKPATNRLSCGTAFLEVKCGLLVGLTTSPPSVSRLSRKWTSHNSMGLHDLLQEYSFNFSTFSCRAAYFCV
jgi:hypothetical protein